MSQAYLRQELIRLFKIRNAAGHLLDLQRDVCHWYTNTSNTRVHVLVTSVTSDSLPTPWTVAHQAPLSMGFSRQEYCSGLPSPLPGDLPDPGIEPPTPVSPEFRWIVYPRETGV